MFWRFQDDVHMFNFLILIPRKQETFVVMQEGFKQTKFVFR